MPPIVFVHGNGDTAALWMTTIWRFESNGWPRDVCTRSTCRTRSRATTTPRPQPGRSSTAEHMAYLAAEVDKVLAATGASKVVLVGNSRGGNAIRNYIAERRRRRARCRTPSSAACRTTASGRTRTALPGSEFNGAGPFLRRLNAPQGADGSEVAPGVAWMTIRSDNNDKLRAARRRLDRRPRHADERHLRRAGAERRREHRHRRHRPPRDLVRREGVRADLPLHHRRAAGDARRSSPEARVVLDGKVSGLGLSTPAGQLATNLPLAGATVEVYATNRATGERLGAAGAPQDHRRRRRWGPFVADASTRYEFVIARAGLCDDAHLPLAVPALVEVVNLRPERLADADRDARASSR